MPDRVGNTLVVWFGEPEEEYEVEETGNEIILMKNKDGQVIGFEKLNFIDSNAETTQVNFETITANKLA
ncbi:MAG: DUF2283 domain-containing protein [Cyanobacteria bacterium P01_F01_bin.143]